MAKATARKIQFRRKVAAMGKGGRETARQRNTAKAEKTARSKAVKAHNEFVAKNVRRARVNSVKSVVRDKFPMLRSKAHSPVSRKAAALQIKAHRARNPKAKGIASAAGKGIPHFEGSLSKGKLSFKKAIAPGASLKGKRVHYLKLSRHGGKSSVKHLNPPKIKLPVGRAIPPKGLARPIPTGMMGSRGPGLKTNLLKGRGLAHAASVGAKLRARKLGRGLKSAASSAFHAPSNLTSKIGAKTATAIAGKRLTARLKG